MSIFDQAVGEIGPVMLSRLVPGWQASATTRNSAAASAAVRPCTGRATIWRTVSAAVELRSSGMTLTI